MIKSIIFTLMHPCISAECFEELAISKELYVYRAVLKVPCTLNFPPALPASPSLPHPQPANPYMSQEIIAWD
jgi:hypothetical protein